MPRPLRLEFENAVYHVMNRGRGRRTIYHGPQYFQAFLASVAEATQRFGLVVYAYCLMDNHYHLLVGTPRANLSRCMRHINGTYTQRYNKLRRTDGPLFRGRYKSVLVDSDAYLLQLSRYIHRNPIELKTPMVQELEGYLWSSYPSYINQVAPDPWLARDLIYEMLGAHQKYSGYRAYVAQGNSKEITDFYNHARLKPFLATDQYMESILEGAKLNVDRKRVARSQERFPTLEEIVELVARKTGATREEILIGRRGRGGKSVARWMAIQLARDYSGTSLGLIASYFNMSHISGVAKATEKLTTYLLANDREARILKGLYQYLTP